MRILTDEELDLVLSDTPIIKHGKYRFPLLVKTPLLVKILEAQADLTARLVREETLKELIEQQGSFFIQGAVNAIDSPFIKTGVPNKRGYWVFISEAKLSQGVMPK
jgi:hypothetical protein